MNDRITELKRKEKEFHDDIYSGEGPLPPVSPEEVEGVWLQPVYANGLDRYSDNKRMFHKIILEHGGWEGKYVNDYACGTGEWAVYFAMTGAAKVAGFDISETAIRRGRERVHRQGLEDTVTLDEMDASDLTYPDDTFDLVIGHSAIHHVIKYPNVFEEIHRILKLGGRAFFFEGLADFLPFRFWWKIKGDVNSGDVPILSRDIRRKAQMFSNVRIIGDTFLYSVKTFLVKKNEQKPGATVRTVLRLCKYADDILFRVIPPLRRWGSFSYIILTK